MHVHGKLKRLRLLFHSGSTRAQGSAASEREVSGAIQIGQGNHQEATVHRFGHAALGRVEGDTFRGQATCQDDFQLVAEEARIPSDIEDCVRRVNASNHGNNSPGTATVLVHSVDDSPSVAIPPLRQSQSGMATFRWALETIRDVSETFGPLKTVAISILNALERYEGASQIDEDLARAAKTLKATGDVLEKHRLRVGSLADVEGYMQSLAQTMMLVKNLITREPRRGLVRRMLDTPNDIKDVSNALRMLGGVTDLFVMNITTSMDAKLDTLLQNQLLRDLPLISTALHQAIESDGCVAGTRVRLLSELLYWATTTDDVPPVCWLTGPAGFGKTTVAYTICGILQGLGALGGSFFCSRGAGIERRTVRSIFPTLARSLALSSRSYAMSLAETLTRHPGVRDYASREQFIALFPASPVTSDTEFDGKIKVMVIDALDECEDEDKVTINMLQILRSNIQGRRLKFLIASRPEPSIRRAFEMPNSRWSSIVRLQDIPEDITKADVSKYMAQQLTQCAQLHSLSNWPSHQDFHKLQLRASGLFIYAATACRYIATFGGDPKERLSEVVNMGSAADRSIDHMYNLVLSNAWSRQTAKEWSNTIRLLQAIVYLREPLAMQGLAQLLDIDEERLRKTTSVLHSTVHIPEPGSSDPVTTFHASFTDYLLSSSRSSAQPWTMDGASAHLDIFHSCLQTMKMYLHFNISHSRTSYASNQDQPNRLDIAVGLRYACIFWMDHLEKSEASLQDMEMLSLHLPVFFLFWLEALSVMECSELSKSTVARLLKWAVNCRFRQMHDVTDHRLGATDAAFSAKSNLGSDPNQRWLEIERSRANKLVDFAQEANRFVIAFAIPIKISAPHIYLSALAYPVENSTIIAAHRLSYASLPVVATMQQQHVPPLVFATGAYHRISSFSLSPDGQILALGFVANTTISLWDTETGVAIGEPLHGHNSGVLSISFSPDGKLIASGSADNTIRLWTTESDPPISKVLYGHKDWVSSIAFSPDGQYIASGSDDLTIRLWDTKTGAHIGEPLHGHEGWVNSVAFLPSGTRIASGSTDKTIHFWDASTGASVGHVLHHESWVSSITVSPDGRHVASGSGDGTIRLWDMETGRMIYDPICGHESHVSTVTFSPSGRVLASGSDDTTIRLWHAESGTQIGKPLRDHKDCIISVAFSPDGKWIASASADILIRSWNMDAEVSMPESPPHAHGDWITSLAFSPKGGRIVSGSDDTTIRLWNTDTGAHIGGPLCRHASKVNCVVFSPDGKRIASGAGDKTIQLWDTETAAPLGEPLRGHEDSVCSIAFSPDGTRIVSGSWDKTIRLWDVETSASVGEPLRVHEDWVTSVTFSPDGRYIASGSDDMTIRLWDTESGSPCGEPLRGHEACVNCVAFSFDGRLLASGSDDATVRLWDTITRALVGKPLSGHGDRVRSIAFSPNGKCIASGSWDGTIRLWHTETGSAIANPLWGHWSSVTSVVFSPDGRHIASGAWNRTIRIWNVKFGAPNSESLRVNEDRLASSSEGMKATYSSDDKTIQLCDAKTGGSIDSLDRNEALSETIANNPPNATSQCVAFSPNSAHSTDVSALLPRHSKIDPRDAFSLDSDGWLRGPRGELFLWIPPEYHAGLWSPRTHAIIGTHPVTLDLSRFVHGEQWTDCYHRPDQDGSNAAQ